MQMEALPSDPGFAKFVVRAFTEGAVYYDFLRVSVGTQYSAFIIIVVRTSIVKNPDRTRIETRTTGKCRKRMFRTSDEAIRKYFFGRLNTIFLWYHERISATEG